MLTGVASIPQFDAIVANLPYVDNSWERSPELRYEPAVSLYADDGGLAIIYRLIDHANGRLSSDGCLVLEADPRQFASIIDRARLKGLQLVSKDGFCLIFTNISPRTIDA